jgi:hypothetical protein
VVKLEAIHRLVKNQGAQLVLSAGNETFLRIALPRKEKRGKVMAKTVVSAFDHQQAATHILDSVVAGGFDAHLFSIIDPLAARASPVDSMMTDVPSVQARLYQKHLRMGDSLLVARVSENDVARLIKLLQSTGGHHIEAFDQVNHS